MLFVVSWSQHLPMDRSLLYSCGHLSPWKCCRHTGSPGGQIKSCLLAGASARLAHVLQKKKKEAAISSLVNYYPPNSISSILFESVPLNASEQSCAIFYILLKISFSHIPLSIGQQAVYVEPSDCHGTSVLPHIHASIRYTVSHNLLKIIVIKNKGYLAMPTNKQLFVL